MPFKLTPQQEYVRKIVREYCNREIIPLRRELEKDELKYREEQLKKQAKLGHHLHIIPRNEGGTGIGYVAFVIAIEEIGAAWPDFGFGWLPGFAYAITRIAGSEIRKKYMPGILKGEVNATPVITEPTGGSDVLGIQTTAKKVDQGWLLNGRKCFIEWAELTDFILVLAKTGDPNAPETKGPKALSAFVVEKGMPGYRIGRREHTITRKYDLAEVIFDNVFVPDCNLVGEVGRGMLPVFTVVRDAGRQCIMGMLLGYTLGAYRCSVQYARERTLYGKPISQLQAIQFRIAEMYIDLEASRALVYRACSLRDEGVRCDAEQSAAKYFATQAALRTTLNAVNIHGAYGVLEDYMPQRYYRSVIPRISAGGTDEAMKMLIASAAIADANPDLSSKSSESAGW